MREVKSTAALLLVLFVMALSVPVIAGVAERRSGAHVQTATELSTRASVSGVRFCAGGRYLIVARDDYEGHGGLELWSSSAGGRIRTLPSGGAVVSLSVSRSGSLCACVVRGTSTSAAYVLQVPSGKVVSIIRDAGCQGVCFVSRDRLATLSEGRESLVKLWDLGTGRLVHEYRNGVKLRELPRLEVSPSGSLLVCAGNTNGETDIGNLRLWSLRTGKQVLGDWVHDTDRYARDEDRISDFGFTPDGKRLVVACGLLRVYDVRSLRLSGVVKVSSTERVECLAVSPRGGVAAVGCTEFPGDVDGASRVLIVDLRSGRVRRWVLVGGGRIRSVVFSPDGKSVVSGSEDGRVRLTVLRGRGRSLWLSKADARVGGR